MTDTLPPMPPRPSGVAARRWDIVSGVRRLLAANRPMTLRQIHYRLVSAQLAANTSQAYDTLSKQLIWARQQGLVPWNWMEDRLRYPRGPQMSSGVADFGADMVQRYRRDVWATQPRYVEFWCEKDALSGIFEDALWPYGVTTLVGRGFDSWGSIKQTADRLAQHDSPIIFCFSDFDPSGLAMVDSLRKALEWFGFAFEIERMALTREDIDAYNLPPDFTKPTDTRAARHIARHGDIAVELDALPVDVLRQRVVQTVEAVMDLEALDTVRRRERADRREIARRLGVPG